MTEELPRHKTCVDLIYHPLFGPTPRSSSWMLPVTAGFTTRQQTWARSPDAVRGSFLPFCPPLFGPTPSALERTLGLVHSSPCQPAAPSHGGHHLLFGLWQPPLHWLLLLLHSDRRFCPEVPGDHRLPAGSPCSLLQSTGHPSWPLCSLQL